MAITWSNSSKLTEKGIALQAKMIAGMNFSFTRAAASSVYVPPADQEGLTALPNETQEVLIESVSMNSDGTAQLDMLLTNTKVQTTYRMHTLGIFADDPDEGEILYSTQIDEEGDRILSFAESPESKIEFSTKIGFGNASAVTIVVDPSDYITIKMAEKMMNEHNLDTGAHDGVFAGKAELDDKADLVSGKVPLAQLPDMDYVSKTGDEMSGPLITTGIVAGSLKNYTTLGENASVLGYRSEASGKCSHAVGYETMASGEGAHVEGAKTAATGKYSHAEGYYCKASGESSHAEGLLTEALGYYSHTEGNGPIASAWASHAEGDYTISSAYASHAEGMGTTASGGYSHSEGRQTVASGECSHAGGMYTETTSYCEFVRGRYNKKSTSSATNWDAAGNAIVLGNGTSDTARSNSFRVTNNGRVYALAAFSASGADYGEYCEWADGNPDSEERLGLFVTWNGDKVRTATNKDTYILGISTANSAVIGNSDVSTWNGMYLKDRWGRHELEETVTEDENGNKSYGSQFIVNPDYDPEAEYINREERPEWVDVGMLGRLWVIDDGTCEVGSFCKPDKNGHAAKSDEGYMVLKKDNGFVWVMFR